jgi:demethylmenaquinone methyltransferase/2-methoxy-6-polyprenyl-1,4-benzoquinol methylase
MSEVKPYQEDGSKKEQVAEMFDNIAHRYDFLNHTLSLGIDRGWRKKAVHLLSKARPKKIMDVATGTGDFALQLLSLNPDQVVGVDISRDMLAVGNQKVKKRGHDDRVELVYGDSENLQFDDNSFDAVTVAFGVRNFEHLEKGLGEMLRVMKPGAQIAILEFSKPKNRLIKGLYYLYFKRILPVIGKWVSKDARAYTYLPESVEVFPHGDSFIAIMEKVGYRKPKQYVLSFGIASIYFAQKA